MATSMNKKKVATSKTTVDKVESVETDNGTVAENKKVEEPKAKKFEQTDLIPCRSITVGTLVMTGIRSGNFYRWMNNDDIIDVEYRDLQAAIMSGSRYIYDPCFIIEDNDFINQNSKLKDFYDNMYDVSDLRNILRIPNEQDMIHTIQDMPRGMIQNLRALASTMVMNHEIDSIRRVKALERVLDIDLSMGLND